MFKLCSFCRERYRYFVHTRPCRQFVIISTSHRVARDCAVQQAVADNSESGYAPQRTCGSPLLLMIEFVCRCRLDMWRLI